MSGAERVVVVTGGASGLGAAVVDAVEKVGWHPVALDLRAPERDVEHLVVDLTDRAAVTNAVSGVVAAHGALHGVVTCAGMDVPGTLIDVPADSWERVVQVNLLGTVNTVRAALPALIETRGTVVTVASTLGLRALPDATAYCASKFAVVGFTRALTLEMQGQVGVTLLVPGGMATSFFDDRDERYAPGPDVRLNDPAAVAAAVVTALQQPQGCELRELVVTASRESSWP